MTGMGGLVRSTRGRWRVAVITAATAAGVGCGTPARLTQLVEAQGLASALHIALTRSVEAGNRALMATDDTTAAAAANESRDAVASIDRLIGDLQLTVESLTFQIELKRLDGFKARFDEYRRLNDDTLSLVLENTNVKAQRLSFGPSAEAADAFHQAIEATVAQAPEPADCTASGHAARAWASVLEIRALYPRHIAEAEDEEMTRMEAAMTGAAARARASLEQLTDRLPAARGLADARTALERFMAVHAEILDLSRRNSNVRALALSLGRKRTVAADAEAQIIGVEEALKTHDFTATR
jgi:hypothetical protein